MKFSLEFFQSGSCLDNSISQCPESIHLRVSGVIVLCKGGLPEKWDVTQSVSNIFNRKILDIKDLSNAEIITHKYI